MSHKLSDLEYVPGPENISIDEQLDKSQEIKIQENDSFLENEDKGKEEFDAPGDLEYVPAPEQLSVDEILNPSIETDNVEHGNILDAGDSTKEKTEKPSELDDVAVPEHVTLDDWLVGIKERTCMFLTM